jgi:hypothetical protein
MKKLLMFDIVYPANSIYIGEKVFGEMLYTHYKLESYKFNTFEQFLDSKKFFVIDEKDSMTEFSLKGVSSSKEINQIVKSL